VVLQLPCKAMLTFSKKNQRNSGISLNLIQGKPPAVSGDSQSLTVPGIYRWRFIEVGRRAIQRSRHLSPKGAQGSGSTEYP